MARKHLASDESLEEASSRPRRARREVVDQFRQYYGELTDESLDYLEFEEEFEDFEPIPQKRKGRY